jgi:hypothetical protein
MTDWQTFAQMYYNGAYQNNTALVMTDPAVSISRGVADDLDLKPGSCSFRLLDDADRYRPSNVASDLYGQTGAYMRGAYATGGAVLFTGEAQAMTPGQTDYVAVSGGLVTRGVKYVDVRLGGPLARVGRWRDEVAAPLSTQINGYTNLRGHFPLDDGRDAIAPRNLYPPGRPGSASGVSFATFDGPGSGAQVVKGNAAGTLGGSFSPMSTSAGWQVAWSNNIQSASGTGFDVLTVNTSSGYVWRWSVALTSYTLTVDKPDGTNALTAVYGTGTGAEPGKWIATRMAVTQSGGNVTVEGAWYAEAAEVFYGFTETFAGTMGAPTTWRVPGNATTDDSGFCNVFALTGVTDDLTSAAYTEAFNGYVRENAADRFGRLCDSRSLPYAVRGDADRSVRMGPQPLKTINDQFKEIRQSEGGLIFDRGDNIGVVLATRGYLYDQAAAPAIALTYPTQVSGLAEVTDARDVYNQVTATTTDGQSFTVSEPNGKLGTANPPTGAGLVDQKIDVNVWDPGVLEDITTFWLRYWTNEGPRFDSIVIDLDAQPSLLSAVNALEPGMFVTVTGRTPDPLLLMITGLNRQTHRSRNVCSLEVVDGRIFDVAIYDDAGSRYDSATTTVASNITSSATTLPVTTTNIRDVWSTTSVPYALVVLGERVTCTAASAPAGSGPYTQNLTITRGVNGFSKALTTGARVGLADPVRRG